jgi:hypothetical protein
VMWKSAILAMQLQKSQFEASAPKSCILSKYIHHNLGNTTFSPYVAAQDIAYGAAIAQLVLPMNPQICKATSWSYLCFGVILGSTQHTLRF